MRIVIRLLAVAALLAGCATSANYEKMLASWIGQSEDDLVRNWGPPDNVYNGSTSRYLTYMRVWQGYMPGSGPYYRPTMVGNRLYAYPYGGSPGYVYTESCKTTFELADGRIARWRWEGDACRLTEKELA